MLRQPGKKGQLQLKVVFRRGNTGRGGGGRPEKNREKNFSTAGD
jgi:hypothetical protein